MEFGFFFFFSIWKLPYYATFKLKETEPLFDSSLNINMFFSFLFFIETLNCVLITFLTQVEVLLTWCRHENSRKSRLVSGSCVYLTLRACVRAYSLRPSRAARSGLSVALRRRWAARRWRRSHREKMQQKVQPGASVCVSACCARAVRIVVQATLERVPVERARKGCVQEQHE